MTVSIVLDPALILGLKEINDWTRLSNWLEDRRVRLGPRLWSVVGEQFYQGALEVPTPIRKIVNQSLGSLLARGPILEQEAALEATVLSCEYAGFEGAREHLIADLGAVAEVQSVVLGSDAGFWGQDISNVGLVPPPPLAIPVHLSPGLPTDEDLLAERQEWYAGRRILVVGGQVEQRILEDLNKNVGLSSSHIEWVPSERNKKAKNIDAMIKGLDGNAIVICVVGKVGHDVSGKMAAACKKKNLQLHQVEYSSHLRSYLTGLADTGETSVSEAEHSL